jgi:hypothetical protein
LDAYESDRLKVECHLSCILELLRLKGADLGRRVYSKNMTMYGHPHQRGLTSSILPSSFLNCFHVMIA